MHCPFDAVHVVFQGIQLLETCRVQDTAEEKKMNSALLVLYMNASLCALKLGQGARAKKYAKKVRKLRFLYSIL